MNSLSASISIFYLIVIYNNKIEESITLCSLKQKNMHKSTVAIWNNGPDSLYDEFKQSLLVQQLKQQGYQVEFYEDLANAPLSIIYNSLISQHSDYDRFIILDHDTELTESYINAINILPKEIDLILPHIEDVHTGELVAPTNNGAVVLNDGKISLAKPGSVSSGMAISKNLVELVKKYYKGTIFDENFALYGIDSTFLMRIRKIAKKEQINAICQGYLKHSLSLSLEENTQIKSFRGAELSYDKALTLRHYPSFGKFKTVLRDLKKIRRDKSLLTTKDIYRCLWTGKHPRCIEYKKNNS